MKNTFRTFIAVIAAVSLLTLFSTQSIARQGNIIIETGLLTMTGKRENSDNQGKSIPEIHRNNGQVIVTEQIQYTGNRKNQP